MAIPIEDRIAIDDLITAYAEAVDGADVLDVVDLVTDDIVIEGSISGRHVGLNGLREWAGLASTISGTSRHLISCVRMDAVDDGFVRVSTHFAHLLTEPNADAAPVPRFRAAGRYEFVVRRTDAGWRIARRTAFLDGFD